jgi:hypothetical protein
MEQLSYLTILTILTILAINTVVAENFPDQPGFAAAAHAQTVAAHALQTVSNELAKCSNLPAIQGGEAIIGIIQGIERRISARLQFDTRQ